MFGPRGPEEDTRLIISEIRGNVQGKWSEKLHIFFRFLMLILVIFTIDMVSAFY